jgi:magnesium chelatase subunit D
VTESSGTAAWRPRGSGEAIDTRGLTVAALLAVDPAGLGGALLRARSPEHARHWVSMLAALLPEGAPVRRMPVTIGDDRLLGGLDLAATLAASRPVEERGLLAAAHGGVVVLPMAERAGAGLVSRLSAVLDSGRVMAPRAHGEGEPAELLLTALADRLAFHHVVGELPEGALVTRADVQVARALLSQVVIDEAMPSAVVQVALAHGVESTRAMVFAVRAARAAAALDGRVRVSQEDLEIACALVIGPRATMIPMDELLQPPPPQEPPPQDQETPPTDESEGENDVRELDDLTVEVMAAVLPAALLAIQDHRDRKAAASSGKAGTERATQQRGRRVGTRRGDPRSGARLDVLETVRAAAPWQEVRRRLVPTAPREKLHIRTDDFRVRRYVERNGTTVLFVVDASGSSALHRLAEAKGAVELLLGESYARRDLVSLIAFRGKTADVLLAPTRAIAAAKRALAALPGGGGTPLATAIDCAREQALLARRAGQDAVVVFLTDARANVARDGSGGRPQAEQDAMASARGFAAMGVQAILLDTSPRPSPFAAMLAEAMHARYVPLPQSDARAISRAVKASGVLGGGRDG